MAHTAPMACPACSEPMMITELTCPSCETKVQGTFSVAGLHRLNPEQMQFVEVFLRCRGNIKEVERDLKLSYPTVRARLDQVIQTMGYSVQARDDSSIQDTVDDVLHGLDDGSMSFEEAIRKLREGTDGE